MQSFGDNQVSYTEPTIVTFNCSAEEEIILMLNILQLWRNSMEESLNVPF